MFIGHQVQHTDEDAWPDDVPGFWPAIDQMACNIHDARKRPGLFTRTAAADDVLRDTKKVLWERDLPEVVSVQTSRWRAHLIKWATLFDTCPKM